MLLRLLLQFRDISCLVQCRPGEELADDLLQCTPVQGVVVGDQDGEIGGGQCGIFFVIWLLSLLLLADVKIKKDRWG
jgi:hypothetical protein